MEDQERGTPALGYGVLWSMQDRKYQKGGKTGGTSCLEPRGSWDGRTRSIHAVYGVDGGYVTNAIEDKIVPTKRSQRRREGSWLAGYDVDVGYYDIGCGYGYGRGGYADGYEVKPTLQL